MDEDKEEKDIVIFKGNEIINAEKISIQHIADQYPDDVLSYRTAYAFFKRNGTGSVETAAKIALGMRKSLNDIYVPADGSGWATSKRPEPTTGNERSETALSVLELLERPYNCEELTRMANRFLRSKNFELAHKIQALAEKAETLMQEKGGEQNAETE